MEPFEPEQAPAVLLNIIFVSFILKISVSCLLNHNIHIYIVKITVCRVFFLLKKLYYVKLLKQKKKLLFKYIDDIDTPVLLHGMVRVDQIEFNLSRKRFKRPAARLLIRP